MKVLKPIVVYPIHPLRGNLSKTAIYFQNDALQYLQVFFNFMYYLLLSPFRFEFDKFTCRWRIKTNIFQKVLFVIWWCLRALIFKKKTYRDCFISHRFRVVCTAFLICTVNGGLYLEILKNLLCILRSYFIFVTLCTCWSLSLYWAERSKELSIYLIIFKSQMKFFRKIQQFISRYFINIPEEVMMGFFVGLNRQYCYIVRERVLILLTLTTYPRGCNFQM